MSSLGCEKLHAPAKLNLGLRVVGRRSDGYHEIESLFVPIQLFDELEFEWNESSKTSISLSFSGESPEHIPADQGNIAVRAAEAFLGCAGICAEIQIRLKKRIPSPGGLGGGSSDAGAVLRGLQKAFPAYLTPEMLRVLALELGADVPYFLDPRPSLVTGIGEKIEPLAGIPALTVLLAHPGISLMTAEVYKQWDQGASALTEPHSGSTMRAVSRLQAESWMNSDALTALIENDLEQAVMHLSPAVSELKQRLCELGALAAGMTGSGPTVYGVFQNSDLAVQSQERLVESLDIWSQVVATESS